MSLVSIQTLAFISYCSPVQGRMAGASTSVCKFDNVVRGQHIHKSARTPLTDKMSKCILWEDNECDKYAVNNQLYQHTKGGCTQPSKLHRVLSTCNIMTG